MMRRFFFQLREDAKTVGRGDFRVKVEDERVKVPAQFYALVVMRFHLQFVDEFLLNALMHPSRYAKAMRWREEEVDAAVQSFLKTLKEAIPSVRWVIVPIAGHKDAPLRDGDFGARVTRGTLYVHQHVLDACQRLSGGSVKHAEIFLTFVQDHFGTIYQQLGWLDGGWNGCPVSRLMRLLKEEFPKIPWTSFDPRRGIKP